MLLYIYLGISIITFLLFVLTNISIIHMAKVKYGSKIPKDNKPDVAGEVLSYIKIAVICFIPLVNMFFLFIILFMNDRVSQRSKDILEKAFGDK